MIQRVFETVSHLKSERPKKESVHKNELKGQVAVTEIVLLI